jgi:hypothetical protein
MSNELGDSAQRFARSSLRAFLDRDWPIFFLHAGTALEQLAKAYLAEIDPSLVAGNDFNSLLHVRGLSQHASTSHLGMKTITVTEALKRVGQLVPTIPPLAEELAFVVNVRNGVAHAGRADAKEAQEVLVPFIKACDQLLPGLKLDRWTFWGDLTEVVEARLLPQHRPQRSGPKRRLPEPAWSSNGGFRR